jgi:hypothetical protein
LPDEVNISPLRSFSAGDDEQTSSEHTWGQLIPVFALVRH